MIVHFQGIALETAGLRAFIFKIKRKINVMEMKTKLHLVTFILLWIKWTRMVEIKHKDFRDVVPKVQDIQSLQWYKNC